MIIFSINPKSLPKKLYNPFKIITSINGSGTMLIIIASLFLSDKHAFHKVCGIILFLGGIIYIISEFLVSTTKEEINDIKSFYNKNINNKITINKSLQITNISNSVIARIEASTAVFTNNNNNMIINNNNIKNVDDNKKDENNNDLINEEDPENSNIKAIVNSIDAEIKNNKTENEYNNKKGDIEKNNNIGNIENNNNILINEIIRKTDNPYEIPDDF